MHIIQDITLFFDEIYTTVKKFTQPPVVTVAINLNSVSISHTECRICGSKIVVIYVLFLGKEFDILYVWLQSPSHHF